MIEWGMMIAFVSAFGISIWKLYAFLPNKQLHDDDTTLEASETLTSIMIATIIDLYDKEQPLEPSIVFEQMTQHPDFDPKHFWRFNINKLNNLITHYFLQHPHASTLEHIYEFETGKRTIPQP